MALLSSATYTPRHVNSKPKRTWTQLLGQRYERFVVGTNWLHVAFKTCAYTYIAFILWLAWGVCPFSSIWQRPAQSDRIPIAHQDFENYFGHFEGFSECGIRARQLYTPPPKDKDGYIARHAYCSNRAKLLEAMSSGGRLGFDAPYTSRGCHHRWYDVAEICMILERFDAIVFIGDETLQTIYSGFNILLREGLSFGSLKGWEMKDEERKECMCENQFVRESCSKYFATSSDEVVHNVGGKHLNSYACQRTPHAFLSIDSSPASPSAVSAFQDLVPRAPPSNYKPIAIVHSLTLQNSASLAAASLTQFLNLADESKRKTPMLWIGPPAAGHIDIKGRKGNQEIWQFAMEMDRIAREKDVEVLGMWNMTVQASSWDGLRFGEKVAITQAMMVVNWLSRLESS